MKDRETVIEALQYMISEDCTETQFDYTDDIEAAIAMLKELTKNKEPVMVRSEFNNMCNMTFHYCSACGDGLPISAKRAKFCPWCGRSVKWE